MFFDYNGIQVDIDNRKINGKSPNIWKYKIIYKCQIIHVSKKKYQIREYFELKEQKSTTYQNIYDVAKTVLGGIYSVKCLH